MSTVAEGTEVEIHEITPEMLASFLAQRVQIPAPNTAPCVWSHDEHLRHTVLDHVTDLVQSPMDLGIEDVYELMGALDAYLRDGTLPNPKTTVRPGPKLVPTKSPT